MNFLKSKTGSIIILVLFTCGIFINTLSNDFTHDDFQVVKGSRFLANDWKLSDIANEGRVMRTLSLMVDHRVFGNDPKGYHLQNIIWHILNTIILYFFVLNISKDQKLSLIVSLLFSSHPIHVEVVANISNRKDLLAFFFMLSSILFYVNSYHYQGYKKFSSLSLSFFSFIIALLSKQAAVTLPLLIVAYEVYFVPKEKRLILGNLLYVSPFIVLCLVYGFHYLNPIARFANSQFEYKDVLALFMSSLSYYCQLLLWPVNLSAEHYISIVKIRLVLSLLILELLIVGIVKTRLTFSLFSFGLLWFVINLLPISNLIPDTAYFFIAERYMYIPSMGFALVLGTVIQNFSIRNKHISLALLSIIVVFFSLNTIHRNTVWKNDLVLWTDTLKKYPDSDFAKIKIADYYRSIGMPEKMISYYYGCAQRKSR